MAPRTREERLFGAACLRVKLEKGGTPPAASEIYQATIADLGLSETDVEQYLARHRATVESALASGRKPTN